MAKTSRALRRKTSRNFESLADNGAPDPIRDLKKEIERLNRAGQPSFRETIRLFELYAQKTRTPNTDWYNEIMKRQSDVDQFIRITGSPPNGLFLFMVWLGKRLRQISDTSNWFRVSEPLTWKLLATDLKGATIGDLYLPLPAFCIEVPPGIFYIEPPEGPLEIQAFSVVTGAVTEETVRLAERQGNLSFAKREPIGKKLVVGCHGNTADQFLLQKVYDITDASADIERSVEFQSRLPGFDREIGGRVGTQYLDARELRVTLLKFVLNFCIYLGSEKAKVEHAHAEEIAKLLKDKEKRKWFAGRIKRLQDDKIFVVGSDVTISPELRELVRRGEGGTQTLSYRTIVRGHWRNQAHGPGRSMRTRRWIEPFVRGADLPTKIVGHKYDVR